MFIVELIFLSRKYKRSELNTHLMKGYKIKDGVFWVGAVDWSPPKFGPSLSKGTTYNSYIVLDEKTVLIDTVKHGFTSETLSRISDITNPEKIDFVIIGNSDMDHSGSLPFVMKKTKDATIVTTEQNKKAIEKYHNRRWNYEIVRDGDKLSLGKRELLFKEVTIGDNELLLTYLAHDNILFSEDLFSQHIATTYRVSKELELVEHSLLSYFVNYLLPFDNMPDLTSYDIDILAPNHGVIFKEDIQAVFEMYKDFISGKTKNKATILYSSAWRCNEKIAYSIADGIASTETEVEAINYEKCDAGNILSKLFESRAIVLGSPSFKGGISPELLKLLYLVEKTGLKNKSVGLFSCYSGNISPIKPLLGHVKKLSFELIDNPLEVKYMPSEEELSLCFEFGRKVGERTKNIKS